MLSQTIWGVEFFMLCDGDSAPAGGRAAGKATAAADTRLRILPRYHVENYFLDEHIWADAFGLLEPVGSWLRDPAQIRACLVDLGKELVSYVTAVAVAAEYRLNVGNIDLMPDECHGKTEGELVALLQARSMAEATRVADVLSPDLIKVSVHEYFLRLTESLNLDTEGWKALIPGKPLLAQFASKARLDTARAKTAYLNAVQRLGADTFAEVVEIFRAFAETDALPTTGPNQAA